MACSLTGQLDVVADAAGDDAGNVKVAQRLIALSRRRGQMGYSRRDSVDGTQIQDDSVGNGAGQPQHARLERTKIDRHGARARAIEHEIVDVEVLPREPNRIAGSNA